LSDHPLRFKVGFVHTSAGRAVRICRDAKQRGLPVVVETCPQYLLFTAEELDRVGPYA
jgi:dihydroorotase-like cyclic amidohydrolase